MKKALIIIDYQNDFVHDFGTLSNKSAKKIELPLLNKIHKYEKGDDDIIFICDNHTQYENSRESNLFEKHCEKDSWGSELFGRLNKYKNKFERYEKNSYLLDIANIEKIISRKYEQIEFAGVLTNVCVLQHVILFFHLLNEKSYPTRLVVDKNCVSSLSPYDQNYALHYMKNMLGVEIIDQ